MIGAPPGVVKRHLDGPTEADRRAEPGRSKKLRMEGLASDGGGARQTGWNTVTLARLPTNRPPRRANGLAAFKAPTFVA